MASSEAKKAANRRWYLAHREEARERARTSYAATLESSRASERVRCASRYRDDEAYAEAQRERSRAYRARNRDLVNARQRDRNARLRAEGRTVG